MPKSQAFFERMVVLEQKLWSHASGVGGDVNCGRRLERARASRALCVVAPYNKADCGCGAVLPAFLSLFGRKGAQAYSMRNGLPMWTKSDRQRRSDATDRSEVETSKLVPTTREDNVQKRKFLSFDLTDVLVYNYFSCLLTNHYFVYLSSILMFLKIYSLYVILFSCWHQMHIDTTTRQRHPRQTVDSVNRYVLCVQLSTTDRS